MLDVSHSWLPPSENMGIGSIIRRLNSSAKSCQLRSVVSGTENFFKRRLGTLWVAAGNAQMKT